MNLNTSGGRLFVVVFFYDYHRRPSRRVCCFRAHSLAPGQMRRSAAPDTRAPGATTHRRLSDLQISQQASECSGEPRMTELLIAFGLVAGVVAAHEIGFWLASLTRSADEPFDRQVALVRASTAGLVAFLVGFAFSGAASRFIDRLDIIVKEANAVGTAYLRADAIAEPQRGELKTALKEYAADRVILLSREGRDQIEP